MIGVRAFVECAGCEEQLICDTSNEDEALQQARDEGWQCDPDEEHDLCPACVGRRS